MSFREEERQQNNCPSRGLGLAAAAIGVGVGAALYYFFSKRPEYPHGEGSTDPGWQPETLEAYNYAHPMQYNMEVDSDSYTTISEDFTTDTSMNDDEALNNSYGSIVFNQTILLPGSVESNISISDQYSTDSQSDISLEQSSVSDGSISEEEIVNSTANNSYESEALAFTTTRRSSFNSDSDVSNGWDVTNSSEDVPEYSTRPNSTVIRLFGNISAVISPRRLRKGIITEEEQLAILREQALNKGDVGLATCHVAPKKKKAPPNEGIKDGAFTVRNRMGLYVSRERPWTTEECSICFEMINRGQEVMTLPCTHHFHQACILPWLQEQQTCPNCRKRTE